MAILQSYLARKNPELVEILPPSKVVVRTLWLVLHKDMRRTARLRILADHLVSKLGREFPLS